MQNVFPIVLLVKLLRRHRIENLIIRCGDGLLRGRQRWQIDRERRATKKSQKKERRRESGSASTSHGKVVDYGRMVEEKARRWGAARVRGKKEGKRKTGVDFSPSSSLLCCLLSLSHSPAVSASARARLSHKGFSQERKEEDERIEMR